MGNVKRRKLPPQTNGKKFVSLSYWPEKVGIVVARGDEVSEVKFTDGTYQFVTNEHLIEER